MDIKQDVPVAAPQAMEAMPDSTELPFELKDWREERRFKAWKLREAGWKQSDIARELGVSQAAVSRWMKSAGDGGVKSLRSQANKRSSLDVIHIPRLAECINFGAETFGFDDDKWTRERFIWLLKNKFDVEIWEE